MINRLEVKLGSGNCRKINIENIKASLHRVQAVVATPLSNPEFNNIILAYEHVNSILEKPRIWPEDLININNLCILGITSSSSMNMDWNDSLAEKLAIMESHKRIFYEHIDPIWNWFSGHSNLSPYLLGSGLYTRIVKHPKLFANGNKRTGSVMLACIFAKKGIEPFHLDVDTAADFFSLSLEIQDSLKYHPIKWLRFLYYKSQFAKFLENNFDRS